MNAPTSVSSRFNARPTTPLPKSSISLSIASAKPSILATPSPISRTVPTFCLTVVVLTPEIWASISCNKLLIKSKAFFERRQPGLDAAIIDVAADFQAQTTDERRVLGKRKGQTRAVNARQTGL